MGAIADEVMNAARENGLSVQLLSETEAHGLRAAIENAYSPSARRWPLWESMRFPAATQDAKAWAWIGEFVGSRQCILLFNPQDEPSAFQLSSGTDLDTLLRETFQFEFYVVDEPLSFLLCFNHHDVLLAAGTANDWLKRKVAP